MVRDFEQQEIAPGDINRFEWLWLVAMMVSAVVAVEMYDYSIHVVGPYLAAIINIGVFVVAVLLMMLACRRNNVARLLLLPFLALIALYDFSHLSEMLSRNVTPYLAALRLGLMVVAIRSLFTPASRAWYALRAE